MAYWLIKSPYRTRTWSGVLAAGEFQLYGIRNAQSRNNIAQMQPGDEALFYFQQTAWGIMQVSTEPAPDSTSAEKERSTGPWLSIAFAPIHTLAPPVLWQGIKSNSSFQNSPLLQQPRLSVVPLTADQWRQLITIAG